MIGRLTLGALGLAMGLHVAAASAQQAQSAPPPQRPRGEVTGQCWDVVEGPHRLAKINRCTGEIWLEDGFGVWRKTKEGKPVE